LRKKIMNNKRYLIGMACVTGLVFGMSAYASEVCDYIYAVHDKGLNDSQIVRYKDGVIEPLGPSRNGYDIESLDISSEGVMYGAASDDHNGPDEPGTLYEINMANGEILSEKKTGCNGLDGISFNPITEELWGWSQTDGLVNLDEDCETIIDPPANIEVEDMSWNNAGNILYFAYNVGSNPDSNDASKPHRLGKYVPGTGVELGVCKFQAPEIEALEVNEEGNLLIGYHDHGTQLVTVIDPETCEVVSEGTKVVKYNDIEGIAVCPPQQPASCSSIVGTWTIGMDINCDGTANFTRTSIYHEDFTWSAVGFSNGGTWSQEGCDVEISDTFFNPALIWTATMGEDGNLSGIYSGAFNGCWTGTRSSSADAFDSSSMDSPVGSGSSFYK
jgi:hypothetical protein